MSKSDRLNFIASRCASKRSALARLVACDDISPAQFLRLKRRLLAK